MLPLCNDLSGETMTTGSHAIPPPPPDPHGSPSTEIPVVHPSKPDSVTVPRWILALLSGSLGALLVGAFTWGVTTQRLSTVEADADRNAARDAATLVRVDRLEDRQSRAEEREEDDRELLERLVSAYERLAERSLPTSQSTPRRRR